MNLPDMHDRELVPAKVLSLIRDGKVATVSELRAAWRLDFRTDALSIMLENRLGEILDNLAEAGLVLQQGERLAPTDLIAKIQKALHLSLRELSKTCQGAESGDMFVEPSVIEN